MWVFEVTTPWILKLIKVAPQKQNGRAIQNKGGSKMENQPYQKLNVNRQYLDQMANGQIG